MRRFRVVNVKVEEPDIVERVEQVFGIVILLGRE